MARDKFNYTHGDNGAEPGTPLNFEENGRPQAQNFDWWWTAVISRINKLWDEFSRLDSNDDGIVDEADEADTLDGKHYADIQDWVSNSSSVPNADTVDGQHFSDIQTWVDNNADVPNADTLDGFHATHFATGSELDSHEADSTNPHNVTLAQLGAAADTHDHDGRYWNEDEEVAPVSLVLPVNPTWA